MLLAWCDRFRRFFRLLRSDCPSTAFICEYVMIIFSIRMALPVFGDGWPCRSTSFDVTYSFNPAGDWFKSSPAINFKPVRIKSRGLFCFAKPLQSLFSVCAHRFRPAWKSQLRDQNRAGLAQAARRRMCAPETRRPLRHHH